MKLLVHSLLALSLAFSISCSRGGAEDPPNPNAANNNQGAPGGNQNVGVLGKWQGTDFEIEVTNNSMLFIRQCPNGTKAQGPIAISFTDTEITILETKVIGTGDCATQFSKGAKLPYVISGNDIQIQINKEDVIQAKRIGAAPAPAPTPSPSQPGNNNGGNNGGGQGAKTFVFFENANCQGRSFNFTKGMDCGRLTGSPVMSASVNGQCSDFQGQTADAGAICQEINRQ